jgi:hypothetical protein
MGNSASFVDAVEFEKIIKSKELTHKVTNTTTDCTVDVYKNDNLIGRIIWNIEDYTVSFYKISPSHSDSFE